MDEQTKLELEAAAFRRLLAHLDERKDVQNIDMMNLTGFCRNCLSRWYQEAAAEKGDRSGQGGRAGGGLRDALCRVEGEASDRGERGAESGLRDVQPRTLTEAPVPPAPNGDRAVRRLFRQRRGAGRQACPAH
jgi:phage terminase small subunit